MHLVVRMVTAATLGVAAILLPKREPDQHWSEIPTAEALDVADDEAPGGE